MSDSEYNNRNIYDEINHKINTMDTTRNSRIQASKRLYNYSDHWEIISLMLNIIAVTSTILSLLEFPENTENINLFLSSIFSVYTIIIQYYVANLNYNERALRFEYQQLGIESLILEMKSILIERTSQKELTTTVSTEEHKKTGEAMKKYLSIMQRYQELLAGYENHSNSDYRVGNRLYKEYKNRSVLSFSSEEDGSFSLDKTMIIIQYLIISVYIVSYLLVYI